jgi:hypothetical protein
MTLSKKLREEVRKKLGIKSDVQLWRRTKEFAVNRGIADRDVALLILAHEKLIDVRKPRYSVPPEKLDKFEVELKAQRSVIAPVSLPLQNKGNMGRRSSRQKVIEFGKGLNVTDPLLPPKIINEAIQMAGVYRILYVFENSVRNLVMKVMSSEHGDKWWELKVGYTIKKKVSDRIKKEYKNRWHGKRGAHPIFYTDIEDLKSIITTNWKSFKNFFPNQQWVTVRIDEIEMSRNIVAHNNPLEKRDIQRLEIYLGDWIKQISKSH